METSWGYPGETLGNTMGILGEYCGNRTIILWEQHENTIGNTVAILQEDWEYSGQTVRILWECCRNTTVILDKYNGNTMGSLWEYHGKAA